MIAYKWIIKEEGRNYSLMTYDIDCGRCIEKVIEYSVGNTYEFPENLSKKPKNYYSITTNNFQIPGFHFWKKIKPQHFYEIYNVCIKKRKGKEIKYCLECEVEDIIKESSERVIAKKFKVLKEIKLKD